MHTHAYIYTHTQSKRNLEAKSREIRDVNDELSGIRTHIHACIHTYTHIYIHTQSKRNLEAKSREIRDVNDELSGIRTHIHAYIHTHCLRSEPYIHT